MLAKLFLRRASDFSRFDEFLPFGQGGRRDGLALFPCRSLSSREEAPFASLAAALPSAG